VCPWRLMFAACCCSDQSHGDVVSVETSASSVPIPKVTDIDESDTQPTKIIEHDSQLGVPAPAVAQIKEKPAPAFDTGQEIVEFEATFDKSGGEKLGLDISAYDGKTLLVGKVKPGPVERWNMQHAGRWEKCILRGDRVIEINGVTGDSDELLGAARSDVLNVTMRRRVEFAVVLEHKANESFGLDFQDASGRVVISRMGEGVAADTNQCNPADMEVRPGDQVLQLNGAGAESAEAVRTAIAACSSSGAAGSLSLRLRRGTSAQA